MTSQRDLTTAKALCKAGFFAEPDRKQRKLSVLRLVERKHVFCVRLLDRADPPAWDLMVFLVVLFLCG
jgi:hypothetical protein